MYVVIVLPIFNQNIRQYAANTSIIVPHFDVKWHKWRSRKVLLNSAFYSILPQWKNSAMTLSIFSMIPYITPDWIVRFGKMHNNPSNLGTLMEIYSQTIERLNCLVKELSWPTDKYYETISWSIFNLSWNMVIHILHMLLH